MTMNPSEPALMESPSKRRVPVLSDLDSYASEERTPGLPCTLITTPIGSAESVILGAKMKLSTPNRIKSLEVECPCSII